MKSSNIIKNKGDSLKGTSSWCSVAGKTRKFFKKLGNHQLRRYGKLVLKSEDPDELVYYPSAPGYWS